jgi:hypothetical protein
MAAVKIKHILASSIMGMYGTDPVGFAKAALTEGKYADESRMFYVTGVSEDAAEEVFDLTNNPSRQEDRAVVYGRGRSLSVGDIVEVYNPDFSVEQWLCCSFGWKEVT